MSTALYSSFRTTPGVAAHIEILNAVDQSANIARGTTGIVEVKPGFFEWHGNANDNTDGTYLCFWDKNLGDNPQGELVTTTINVAGGGGGGGLVFQTPGPSVIPGEVWRKRNDTKEAILYQAIEWDDENKQWVSVDLTTASSLLFKMRQQPNVGSLKVNRTATVFDAVNGVMKFQPITGDWDTSGDWNFEFQVIFNDGRVQTFPVTTDKTKEYGILHIIDDLD